MTGLTVFINFEIDDLPIGKFFSWIATKTRIYYGTSSPIERFSFMFIVLIVLKFGIVVTEFTLHVLWRFVYVKFYSWCESKLAILKPYVRRIAIGFPSFVC